MGSRLPIIEIFGPTVQGEGSLIGQVTHFVRLGGCDYRCSWCDSMHAVDPAAVNQNKEMMLPATIVLELLKLPSSKWVSLSGGNPGMFDLRDLVVQLHDANFDVALETQGSIYQSWFGDLDHLTLSPKPPSAHTKETDFEVLDKIVAEGTQYGVTTLKVVIADLKDDLEYARGIHKRYPHVKFYIQVCNHGPYQPRSLFRLAENLLTEYRYIVEHILKDPDFYDVHITPQMHILLWGNELGR